MNEEQYLEQLNADDAWAPGWEAITTAFETLYPKQDPVHFATPMLDRAMFGGDNYLDGYSIYQSKNGYLHLVTYGFSRLYADKEAFGQEDSGWGYELTFKINAATPDDCMWVIDCLSRLAYYTFTQKRWFDPFQFINIKRSIKEDASSALTGFLVVPDTEVATVQTVHGRVQFLQLVGITAAELEMLIQDLEKAPVLMQKLQESSPFLMTDLERRGDVVF